MVDTSRNRLPPPTTRSRGKDCLILTRRKTSMKAPWTIRDCRDRTRKRSPPKSGRGGTDTQYHNSLSQDKTKRALRVNLELPHQSLKINIPQIPLHNRRVNCIPVRDLRLPSFEPMTFPSKRRNYKSKPPAETPEGGSRQTPKTNK